MVTLICFNTFQLSHFKKFLKKWKAERLRKASFTLQLFFKEVYDVSKLLKVVKKYRFSGRK